MIESKKTINGLISPLKPYLFIGTHTFLLHDHSRFIFNGLEV